MARYGRVTTAASQGEEFGQSIDRDGDGSDGSIDGCANPGADSARQGGRSSRTEPSRYQRALALVTGAGLLLLPGGQALAQSPSPTVASASAAPSAPPLVDSATDDLWFTQGTTPTRIDGSSGSAVERRDVSHPDCESDGRSPWFRQPTGTSIWLSATDRTRGAKACLVRVPPMDLQPKWTADPELERSSAVP